MKKKSTLPQLLYSSHRYRLCSQTEMLVIGLEIIALRSCGLQTVTAGCERSADLGTLGHVMFPPWEVSWGAVELPRVTAGFRASVQPQWRTCKVWC